MENLKLDFEQAKAKHLLFKSKLRSILYGAQVDEAPILSHHECTVGKWIYSRALKVYGHFPEMQELEKVHADIHTSARDLVSLYKEGKIEEARIGLTRMEEIADKLVGLLSVIEQKVEQHPIPENTVPNYQPMEVSLQELTDLAKANEQLDRVIREQSGVLLQERKLLHDFFMQAPAILAILHGPNHTFELANKPYCELIGNRNPKGKTVREVLPELAGQGFYELLDNVYKTGETFIGKEVPISLNRGFGRLDQLFLNFSYQAYRDPQNKIEGILVFAYDVTEQVGARKKLEDAYDHLEVKVKFRNLELEKMNKEYLEKIKSLEKEILRLSTKN